MTDPSISPSIHTVASQPSLKPQAPAAAASGAGAAAEFRSLLSTMLMSGMMGGEEGGGNAMMMTALSSLLEQITSMQVAEETSAPVDDPEAGGGILPVTQGTLGDNAVPAGMPLKNIRLTQKFHGGHNGLDFGIPVGTPVQSTMAGKVVYAGWNNQGYGNLVIVENGPYRTYYAHLSEVPVQLGDEVKAGSVIGLSGNTGNSTGPHLHYEVRKNMAAVDPTPYTQRV